MESSFKIKCFVEMIVTHQQSVIFFCLFWISSPEKNKWFYFIENVSFFGIFYRPNCGYSFEVTGKELLVAARLSTAVWVYL